MSEPAPNSAPIADEHTRARLRRVRFGARGSMLGISELIGLAGSVVILLVVIISYVYFLVPSRSKLTSLQLERARLQTQLHNSQEVVQGGRSTQETVVAITQSLDDFENQRLSGSAKGRMELYDVMNELIRKNGLRNTSGPTYSPLESIGSKNAAGATKSTSTKWQSAYPGISINLTVEGQYQNLRRFIRDIEGNKQFIIINGVELERATETRTAVAAEESGAKPGAAPVSLRLDLATYFQRTGADATSQAIASPQ
ncbi:MAG TPA: GspMb/PilO family protein [Pyrinomonadaceae bacterium]|nr:GspMb/PilO family protein [Pyrinomonadaceae bacterium]